MRTSISIIIACGKNFGEVCREDAFKGLFSDLVQSNMPRRCSSGGPLRYRCQDKGLLEPWVQTEFLPLRDGDDRGVFTTFEFNDLPCQL